MLNSGFFQGLYAAGGPMLAAYADREFETKGSFRATLSAGWTLLGAVMVAVYALTGKLTAETVATSAWLSPSWSWPFSPGNGSTRARASPPSGWQF